MTTEDLQYKDLIYWEDESGKKDNVGVFIRKNTERTNIIYTLDDEIELPDEKIYPIEITNEILEGIEELEKVDTGNKYVHCYIDKGDYADYLYNIDWDGVTYLNIYLYNEKYITKPEYYSSYLKNCLRIGSVRYLHELQHFVDTMNTSVFLYKVNGLVSGEAAILIGNTIYTLPTLLETEEEYEVWKKKVEEIRSKTE